MRILVHEFATGGGMAGVDVPRSLAREGRAMRDALAVDLAAIDGHEIVASVDVRFPVVGSGRCPRLEIVAAPADGIGDWTRNETADAWIDPLIDGVDAVWLVAPETDGCLERGAGRVERRGARLLGSGADAIGLASDKAGLADVFRHSGVAYPRTFCFSAAEIETACNVIEDFELPIVLKPRRGAGSEGVRWFADRDAFRGVLAGSRGGGMIVQEFVGGTPASASVLVRHRQAVVLAVNSQHVSRPGARGWGGFPYRGGITPFEHPGEDAARVAATRACESIPGLAGYVGVDMVLDSTGAVVIEVNPRLTTAFLGLRRTLEPSAASMALGASTCGLPGEFHAVRRVRFDDIGNVLSSEPIPAQHETWR